MAESKTRGFDLGTKEIGATYSGPRQRLGDWMAFFFRFCLKKCLINACFVHSFHWCIYKCWKSQLKCIFGVTSHHVAGNIPRKQHCNCSERWECLNKQRSIPKCLWLASQRPSETFWLKHHGFHRHMPTPFLILRNIFCLGFPTYLQP